MEMVSAAGACVYCHSRSQLSAGMRLDVSQHTCMVASARPARLLACMDGWMVELGDAADGAAQQLLHACLATHVLCC